MQTLFKRMSGLPATTRTIANEFYDAIEKEEGTFRLLKMRTEN